MRTLNWNGSILAVDQLRTVTQNIASYYDFCLKLIFLDNVSIVYCLLFDKIILPYTYWRLFSWHSAHKLVDFGVGVHPASAGTAMKVERWREAGMEVHMCVLRGHP